MKSNQSTIYWWLPNENGWTSIIIISRTSLELLEVKITTRKIGLGSSNINIGRLFQNGKNYLYMSVQLDNKSETIYLRFRTETEPFQEWEQEVPLFNTTTTPGDETTIQLKRDEALQNPQIQSEYRNQWSLCFTIRNYLSFRFLCSRYICHQHSSYRAITSWQIHSHRITQRSYLQLS